VAAWQHIVDVFRQEGAYNVTWLWTVNQQNRPGAQPIRAWWPGANYVTWVGIDGYYVRPSDTFQSVFGQTMTQVSAITKKPILLSETGVSPKTQRFADITKLFNNIRSQNLLGVVWFDEKQSPHGLYRQNWQIEDDPQARIAFQEGISELKIAHT
jgi:beta-mannanase